jgi:mannosyltransferase OCH1-like enzyme
MIPKIIHLTAKSEESLSWEEKHLIARMKRMLPGWECRFYGKAERDAMVREHFPQYWETYNAIKRGVVQADIARIMFLYLWGGFYFDTDYKILKDFDDSILAKKVILPWAGSYIGNAVLGSGPKAQIWLDYLQKIFSNPRLTQLEEKEIIPTTGPLALTEHYSAHREEYDYCYVPERNLFHPSARLIHVFLPAPHESYGKHLCFGSWMSNSLFGQLRIFLRRKVASVLW